MPGFYIKGAMLGGIICDIAEQHCLSDIPRVAVRPMNLSSLDTGKLKGLTELLAKKQSLEAQIAAVNAELDAFVSGKALKAVFKAAKAPREAKESKAPKAPRGPKPGSTRGSLKVKVIEIVKASKTGLSVKEIADAVPTKPANIYSFFNVTGKKIQAFTKGEDGKYAWDSTKEESAAS